MEYYDALDLSLLPLSQRIFAARELAPSLIEPLHMLGLRVQVHRALAPFERFKTASGALTLSIFSESNTRATEADTLILTASFQEKPVAIVGARRLWCEGSLADAYRAMTFPGEVWKINSPVLEELRCLPVAVRSGAEVLPEWRSKGVFRRLSRAMALLLLSLDWSLVTAVVRRSKETQDLEHGKGLGFPLYGYTSCVDGVRRITPKETIDYRLFLAHRAHVKEDLFRLQA